MKQGQEYLEDLINKLTSPLGKANAVLELSKKYQLSEQIVKQAITAFEEQIYNAEDSASSQKSNEARDYIRKAADLSRKILWIEKEIDLNAKVNLKHAADIAREFSFNEKALELYKKAHDERAIEMAEILGLDEEYIELCWKHGEYAKAIKKHLSLGQEEKAKELFKERFVSKTRYGGAYTGYKTILILAEKTGLYEYAIDLCKENTKPYLLAQLAIETNQKELALENLEKSGKFLEGARLAATLTGDNLHYLSVAEKLYYLEVERLENKGSDSSALQVLKEINDSKVNGIKDRIYKGELKNRIYSKYVKLKLFKEGGEYFQSINNTEKALELFEKGKLWHNARKLAEEKGLTEKVKEYNIKLGWDERSAEIELEQGDMNKAIEYYIKDINKKEKRPYFAAQIALKALELCEENNMGIYIDQFRTLVYDLFFQASQEAEESGNWKHAAECAEQAGKKDLAETYRKLDTILNIYI